MLPSISIDLALNLFWLALGASGLFLLTLAERRRMAAGRLWRYAAVLTITLALFPSVSVTDDEASLWFQTRAPQRGAAAVLEEERERNSMISALFDVAVAFEPHSFMVYAPATCFCVAPVELARHVQEGFCHTLSARAPPTTGGLSIPFSAI